MGRVHSSDKFRQSCFSQRFSLKSKEISISELYLSEEFYPVDFINLGNKVMRDFQDLNNHCNTIDWSETVTGIFDARIGLKETKICSPNKLILGHVNTNSIRNNFHSLVYLLDKNIEIFLNP